MAAKKLTASGITTEQIEIFSEITCENGAVAGKVSGPDRGGFLMFVVWPEDRLGLVTTLSAAGGEAGPVMVTERGSETWQRFTDDYASSSGSRAALHLQRILENTGTGFWARLPVGEK